MWTIIMGLRRGRDPPDQPLPNTSRIPYPAPDQPLARPCPAPPYTPEKHNNITRMLCCLPRRNRILYYIL